MIFQSSQPGTSSIRAAPDARPPGIRKATGVTFVLVFTLLFAAALVLVSPSIPVANAAATGLDGSAGCSNGSGVSCTVSLTTSSSADIVIIFTGTTQGQITSPPTVPTGCTGLANRAIYSASGMNIPVIREDYCRASGTLSSQSFSCTASGRVSCVVFAISGANTASPFDGAALPCRASATTGAAGTNAVSCTASTNNAYDFVFGLVAEAGGSGAWATGTNGACSTYKCTMTGTTNSGIGAAVEYAISTSTISSSPLAVKYSNNGAYAIVADAVQALVTTVTVTTTQTLTSTVTSTPAVNTTTITSTPAMSTTTSTVITTTPLNSTVATVVATGTFCVQGSPALAVTCSTSRGTGLTQSGGPSLTSLGVGGLLLAGAAVSALLLNRRRSRKRDQTRTVSA
ncbi:MAG: hypothetical protein OK474_08565 [Thaumarchaeota archaeon]|nr:hypothetical protein [Nitrososphaerota archaeon]